MPNTQKEPDKMPGKRRNWVEVILVIIVVLLVFIIFWLIMRSVFSASGRAIEQKEDINDKLDAIIANYDNGKYMTQEDLDRAVDKVLEELAEKETKNRIVLINAPENIGQLSKEEIVALVTKALENQTGKEIDVVITDHSKLTDEDLKKIVEQVMAKLPSNDISKEELGGIISEAITKQITTSISEDTISEAVTKALNDSGKVMNEEQIEAIVTKIIEDLNKD
ncbi:MAG: DUF4083 family protein [Clostridia bacterium]|nr:DUF4083 family protein [Clostridia bacterium]